MEVCLKLQWPLNYLIKLEFALPCCRKRKDLEIWSMACFQLLIPDSEQILRTQVKAPATLLLKPQLQTSICKDPFSTHHVVMGCGMLFLNAARRSLQFIAQGSHWKFTPDGDIKPFVEGKLEGLDNQYGFNGIGHTRT